MAQTTSYRGMSDLTTIATEFRLAIQRIPSEQRPLGMRHFPRGACGDTALLMGAYLFDIGVNGFRYVSGTRGDHANHSWQSHAWLQRADLIIDITADQFLDMPQAIVVEANSKWHSQFRPEEPQDPDFRTWNGPGVDTLHPMYDQILEAMLQIHGQLN